MFNDILDNLGLAQQYNNLHQGLANQQSFSQQAAAQYNAALAQGSSWIQTQQGLQAMRPFWQSKDWVIDGRPMTCEEFGRELFGEDTPEYTHFLLKYKK